MIVVVTKRNMVKGGCRESIVVGLLLETHNLAGPAYNIDDEIESGSQESLVVGWLLKSESGKQVFKLSHDKPKFHDNRFYCKPTPDLL